MNNKRNQLNLKIVFSRVVMILWHAKIAALSLLILNQLHICNPLKNIFSLRPMMNRYSLSRIIIRLIRLRLGPIRRWNWRVLWISSKVLEVNEEINEVFKFKINKIKNLISKYHHMMRLNNWPPNHQSKTNLGRITAWT